MNFGELIAAAKQPPFVKKDTHYGQVKDEPACDVQFVFDDDPFDRIATAMPVVLPFETE